MLKAPENENSALRDKRFPCPVCQADLPILFSVKQKPYCTCNDCGLQLFFRGKAGIDRLKDKLQNEQRSITSEVMGFYTRLEKLRAEKSALEQKQGIFFRDQSLENAIAAIDAEISKVETRLKEIRRSAEKTK